MAKRAATKQDVEAGNAVFVLEVNGKSVGRPLNIRVPQYALYKESENAIVTPGVIIQAEGAKGLWALILRKKFIGFVDMDGNTVAGILNDFDLLGTEVPTESTKTIMN